MEKQQHYNSSYLVTKNILDFMIKNGENEESQNYSFTSFEEVPLIEEFIKNCKLSTNIEK